MPICSIDKCIIEHCSPTLAGIKPAGLFSCRYEDKLLTQIMELNRNLMDKDVVVSILKRCEDRALVYVYRKSAIKRIIENPQTARFLERYGYSGLTAEKAVAKLKNRIAESDVFPHEIGIFLGYPLGDVVGFINNHGRNCKCVGCWKVYCNECEAVKLFDKYKKCKNIYMKLFERGKTVLQLTVAV